MGEENKKYDLSDLRKTKQYYDDIKDNPNSNDVERKFAKIAVYAIETTINTYLYRI